MAAQIKLRFHKLGYSPCSAVQLPTTHYHGTIRVPQMAYRGRLTMVEASSDDKSSNEPGGDDSEGPPKTISLARKLPPIEYTFILAGFLKIMTVVGMANSAPQDAVRTALGKSSQFLLIPGGLLMCWVAKQVVDSELQERPKFLAILAAVLIFLYFFIYKLLFRYDVSVERIRRPQPQMSGPMADVRARAGDRDRTGLTISDSRSYDKEKGGGYNDLSYYEGRYPSQIKEAEEEALRQGTLSTAELNDRNPLRQSARRAPGVQGIRSQSYIDDQILRPR